MKIIRGVGGFIASPFGVAVVLFVVLFGLSNMFRLVPGPYSIVDNRIAAFEVDKVAELLIDVAWAAFCLFAIKTHNFKWVAAKLVVALILVLQIWDVAARVSCKIAAEKINIGEGIETAKGLCARAGHPGAIYVEIAFGLLVLGWIAWHHRLTLKTLKP